MSRTPPQQIYFNTYNGQVYTGGPALDEALEAGNHPADIFPLSEVLLNTEIPLASENYHRKKYHTDQEILDYGSWISAFVKADSPKGWTTTATLKRAGAMGLGPIASTISQRTGSMWAFRDAIGERGGWRKGAYADWTKKDFIEYGKRMSGREQKKPTVAQAQRWFKQGKGPSESYIRNTLGGFDHFQELLGFPNIDAWEEADYVDYGVRFMEANPGIVPTARRLDFLSRKKRGPSAKAAHNMFGSTRNFQAVAKEAYDAKQEQQQLEIEIRIIDLKEEIASGVLPERLEEMEYETNKDFIVTCAKFKVAQRLLGIADREALGLAQLSVGSFVDGIVYRSRGKIGPGTVETTALLMGVFDDIWPFDDHLEYLKLPERIDSDSEAA